MMKFEYRTVQCPYSLDAVTHPPDEPSYIEGWRKMWADVTMDGIFTVYRREISITNEK